MSIKKIILATMLFISFSCFATLPTPTPVPKPANGQVTPVAPVAKPSIADYCKQHTC